jgi:hypothetical protein
MLRERGIAREWVTRAVSKPAKTELKDDATTHFLKSIPEHDGRVLRVVTDSGSKPLRIITAFFDRRERGEL